MRRKALIRHSILLAITAGLGCQESPSGPTKERSEQRPLRLSSLASGSATIEPTGTSHISLPNYTDETLVHLVVEGLIEVTPDGAAPHMTDARGRQWSWNTCVEGMRMVYGDGWYMWKPGNGCQPNQGYSAQGSFSEYMLMWGTSYAQWDGAIPSSEATYDGEFELTVTPVTGDLGLSANRYVVQADGDVTFKGRIIPDTVGGIAMPYTGVSWSWTADSAGGDNPASNCGPTLTCTTGIPRSGTMRLSVTVNGVEKSQTVHIRVLPCPTGVPELDSLPFLDAMKTAWDSSYPNGPPQDRRERTWSVDCNSHGECVTTQNPVGSATPCHSAWPPGNPDTSMHRAGDGHTHPFYPGPMTDDTLPDNCPRGPNTPTDPRGAAPGPGNDYLAAQTVPGSFQHCIVDGLNIYCFPVGLPPGTADSQMVKVPRVDSLTACRRL